MNRPYAFYKSLRFRFGVVFGSLFLLLLLLTAIFLYLNVKRQFENSFEQYLKSGAALVLGKTELNPLTIPVPQAGEQFLLLYDDKSKLDTLFPVPVKGLRSKDSAISSIRSVVTTRTLETGGRLVIHYSRSATALEKAISELRSVLFLYLPIAFLLSLVTGYFLSGALLRPIQRLIEQANKNAQQSEILLLPLPQVEDELHALTSSLNHMLKHLQESRRQQNAFFASAAHELRTPLSIMLTGLQVARLEDSDSRNLTVIDQQVREVRRLSALVDNLLLMSRLASRSQNVPDERKILNLSEIVLENIAFLNGKAAVRKQIFKVSALPQEGNFALSFQENHLNILIRNLLDNAITHGLEDNVIDVQLFALPQKPLQLIIFNETNQETMDLDRLTKEFEKGDPYREGFGLGLWIVKELASLNQADVSFEFKPPKFYAIMRFLTAKK